MLKDVNDLAASPVIEIENGLRLRIYLQPKAAKDLIMGLHGDEIKISITAPPLEGKANAYLIKYIAKQFAVAKSNVSLIKGELNRHKTLHVLHPKQIPAQIAALLQTDR
ncbi:MAG: hypothetical protein ACI9C4_001315 [Paraglaciecola sp.]|jgi:uncharacterized protein (TIGR00251 family)